MPLSLEAIAWRAARDLPSGSYVNLGIGLPERIADFVSEESEVVLHSENGVLGMGPRARGDAVDWDLINAGKKPVTLLPGGAYFHHADSFAMIRGGHIDVCVMGAFEVSSSGDLANWSTGVLGAPPAVGGAMDLAVGAKAVFVLMSHTTKDGRPKIRDRCTLPLTASGVVKRIYTDLAVVDVGPSGLQLQEVAEGVSPDYVAARTGASLIITPDLGVIRPPKTLA